MPLRYRSRVFYRQLRADSLLVEKAIGGFPEGVQSDALAEYLKFDKNYLRRIMISLTQRGKIWKVASDNKRWNPVWTVQPQDDCDMDYSLDKDDEHRRWLMVASRPKVSYNPWGAR